MSRLENLFMQIFERKQWTVDHIKQQVESYEQSLACNLAASGRKLPEWLLNNGFGSDAPGCSNLEELNGKPIIPDTLFLSKRITTPANNPYFNYPFSTIATKQIHFEKIAEEIPTNAHKEEINVEEPDTNPDVPDLSAFPTIRRSRSRQKAIEKRSSAKEKAKSAKTSAKPSGSDESEELVVERPGVDLIDPVCTDNDAAEPKRLVFEAVGLANLGVEHDPVVEKEDEGREICSNLGSDVEPLMEKEDGGAREISSNLVCVDEPIVEKEGETREISSNLGCDDEPVVEKEESAREIPSNLVCNDEPSLVQKEDETREISSSLGCADEPLAEKECEEREISSDCCDDKPIAEKEEIAREISSGDDEPLVEKEEISEISYNLGCYNEPIEISSSLGSDDEPVADKGEQREVSSDLGGDDEPIVEKEEIAWLISSDLGGDDEPIVEKEDKEREISSDLGWVYKPLVEKEEGEAMEISSNLGCDNEPIVEKEDGEREVSGNLGYDDQPLVEKEDEAKEISSDLGCDHGPVVEKEDEEMEISSDLGCEDEPFVQKEDEALDVSSNLSCDNEPLVEKEDEAMEMSSLVFENTDCEPNQSGVRDVEEFCEQNSLPNGVGIGDGVTGEGELLVDRFDPQSTETESAETSPCIEMCATEEKNVVLDEEPQERPCSVSGILDCAIIDSEQNEVNDEITEPEDPGFDEPGEVPNCTVNDAPMLEKSDFEEPLEMQNCTEIDAGGPSTEIQDNTAGLEKASLDRQTEILNCTDNDVTEIEKPANEDPIEIPVGTETNANEFEKPAFVNPTEIPNCTENNEGGIDNPDSNEQTETPDRTEFNAAGIKKPDSDEPIETPDCAEFDAAGIQKPDFDEQTETPDHTEFDGTRIRKPDCAELDTSTIRKPDFDEAVEVQNKTMGYVSHSGIHESPGLFARDSYSPIGFKFDDVNESNQTLNCTEIEAEEKIEDSIGGESSAKEMDPAVYARDSYSPTRDDRTGDDCENGGEMVEEDPIEGINDECTPFGVQIDPDISPNPNLTASDKGKSVISLQSGGEYSLQCPVSNENITNNTSGAKRLIKFDENVNSWPKRRKIGELFSTDPLATSPRPRKDKQQILSQPSHCSLQNEHSEEPTENNSPLIESNRFSITPSKDPDFATSSDFKEFEIDQEDVMPELEGFNMDISPFSGDQTVNNPFTDHLYTASKNISTTPHFSAKYSLDTDLYRSVPSGLYDLMKSSEPFSLDNDVDGSDQCYSSCLFEYNGSETGISFSGKSDKHPLTPLHKKPSLRKLSGISVSGGSTSSGMFGANPELTCFRIDEDTVIEESEILAGLNAVQEMKNSEGEDSEYDHANDQNALEDSHLEMGSSQEQAEEYYQNPLDESHLEMGNSQEEHDQANDQNAPEENALLEKGSSQEEEATELANDRNTLEDVTDTYQNTEEVQFGTNLSTKPKQSTASSMKGSERKKVLKSSRSGLSHGEPVGSSYKGPERTAFVRGSQKSSSNIVSDVPSFVQLVKQKQQPVVKKREIRVPALEAAEAKKRLDEKRRNEREKQKLERERGMKKRQEETKRRQEELKKKKEAEVAANNRKRQREEREKRPVEKKAKFAVEKPLPVLKEDEELQFDAHDKREAGPSRPSTSVVNSHRKSQTREKVQKEKEYEMTPYNGADEEVSDEDQEEKEKLRRKGKYIPPWARKENLEEYVLSKKQVNPNIFSLKRSFDLNKVLPLRGQKRRV